MNDPLLSHVFFVIDRKNTWDMPIPLLIHGNMKEKLRLYQATTDVHGVEEDVLKMTETFYKIADGVASKAMEMIRYKLHQK